MTVNTNTTSTTSNNGNAVTSSSTASTASSTTSAATTQDEFLKLLVAQLQNQDPTNPMDNTQLTSQMAQIQTVSSLDTINTSITGLGTQFSNLQGLQSVSLVGHDVLVPGNTVDVQGTTGTASYDLASNASSVTVKVMSSAGAVLDTVNLGAQSAGRQSFSIDTSKLSGSTTGLTYSITAVSGTTPVTATTYAEETVEAVSNSSGAVQLELSNGSTVNYSSVVATD